MTTYTARVKKVGRFWEVYVPELDRTTQVVRLDEVKETVRDLANLLTDESRRSIKVARDFMLADALRKRIEEARAHRVQAEDLARKASADMRRAAREMRAEGYTVRDVGEVLDLSYQRVQQLTAGPVTRTSSRRRSKVA